jgi:hypothetical protein
VSSHGAKDPRLSRREVLTLAAGTAVAARLFAAARFVPSLVGGKSNGPLHLPAHLPQLASKATTSITSTPAGDVLRFRSRPDLQLAVPRLSLDSPGQSPGFILMDSHGGPGDPGSSHTRRQRPARMVQPGLGQR